MTAYSAVGSSHAWWGLLDGAGILAGTAGTIADGSDQGMGRLDGVESAELNIPDARAIDIPGDNGSKGSIMLPGSGPIEGQIVTSVRDLTFAIVPQGGKVRTINSNDMILLGGSCPNFKNSLIIINSPALIQTPGSKGIKGWSALGFLNVQIQGKPQSGISNGSPHSFPHRLVGSIVDKLFTGELVVDTGIDWGFTNGVVLDLGVGLYPWTAHTFVADGVATSFVVDETPVAANDTDNLLFKAGAIQAYTTGFTLVPATKTVTIVGAPAATGTKYVLLYRYIPTC